MRKMFVLTILILAASVAQAQTPPLFSANAKYLGWAGAGGGTANAQTVTYSPALAALTTGQAVSWIPSNANTTAATLNVNGLGAKSIVKANGSALVANDLLTTAVAQAVYDGTSFELLDPQSGSGASVACGQLPALTGDTTSSAGSCATATAKINGTSFAGTNGDLVSFGASNIPADSGILASGITQTISSGTSTMGTGGISSASCASAVSTSATGVATTDAIIVSVNADPTGTTGYVPLTTGSLYIWSYPTSGHVNFLVCNNSSSTITPSAITLNWRVVR